MMNRADFIAALRAVGAERYHHLHPFHERMNRGELSSRAIKTWVRNRFYYQKNIPRKDAAILSNCPERAVRRIWMHRLIDHDGNHATPGGIEAWIRLAEACGLNRQQLDDRPLPGVQFAVDAYLNFARTKPWPVAIASSLTEMFAPDLMAQRLAAFQKFYTWIPDWGFDYCQNRIAQAQRDADEALSITLEWCATTDLQRAAIEALGFKCNVLWSLLDAIDAATTID
ncbi:MAG TPA: pyrroloquinoline-quinone synthase PqqC [Terrimicrobiaceae bacterium]